MTTPAALCGLERTVCRVSMKKEPGNSKEGQRTEHYVIRYLEILMADTLEDFISTPFNLNVYITREPAGWGWQDLLADMSPRTDEETSLLLCFLPLWCLVAVQDPHPRPGKVPGAPEPLGCRARRGPATLLPNLHLARWPELSA